MLKTPHSELDYIQNLIYLQKIDPSPYQHRRHFDGNKLEGLAASIQREGLIELLGFIKDSAGMQRNQVSVLKDLYILLLFIAPLFINPHPAFHEPL